MPAVSSIKETKVSTPEPQDPMKYVLQVTDKKVRNLEKRKCKLDQIREKAKSGVDLEKDQKIALDKYDEVIGCLESVHELQKTFMSYNAEWEKQVKKNAKREKMEQQANERKRFQKWLQYRMLLDAFGDEEIREDFETGKHGAVVLTKDNLKQFDELYAMLEPSRIDNMDKEYDEKIATAADHLVCLLDGRDREVVGTTYKELSELLDLSHKCGYFETRKKREEEEEQESEAAAEEAEEEEQQLEEEEPAEPEPQEEPPVPAPAPPATAPSPAPPTALPAPVQQRLEPEPCPAPLEPTTPAMNNMAPPQPTPSPATAPAQPRPSHHQPFLETPYNPHARPRPLQEIVSSVQGNFLFLQDSELDDGSIQNNDPAVLMAQPMVPPSATLTSSLPTSLPTSLAPAEPAPRPSQTFSGPGYGEAAPSMEAEPAPLPDRGQQLIGGVPPPGVPAPPGRLDFPPQGFGQHPAGDSLFPEDSSQMGGAMMPPSVADGPQSQFNLPPMNMAMGQPPVQDNSGDKKFTMNASAPAFQSMYSQVPRGGMPADMEGGDQGTGDAPADYSQAGYQGNGFQNNGFQRGGNRGGYRGNRGRNNNMPNGYNNNRGGQGRGGRTGGGFNQGGFTPRNDYRADGYQGYNNGGFANQGNPGNFPKRGGGGNGNGQNRGGPRGGNGAPRNSNNRGAPRGNYGRPTAAFN